MKILIFVCALVLGQEFKPTAVSECGNGLLNVHLHTAAPFYGIIYADKHRSTCYIQGNGHATTTLSIPLTAMKQCGLQYHATTETYNLIIRARQHRLIILEQDRTFNVSCNRFSRLSGSVMSAAQRAAIPDRIDMGFYNDIGSKSTHLVYGQPYDLIVQLVGPSADFIIHSCVAFGEKNQSLMIVDQAGCTAESNLITNFKYSNNGTATAKLWSIFRFEKSEAMHVQCSVDICQKRACSKVDCDQKHDAPFGFGGGNYRNFETLNSDAQHSYASTTVFVHDAINVTEIRQQIDCTAERRFIICLVIAFAIIFLFLLITNFVFCYIGGFCCCYSTPTSSRATSECAGSDRQLIKDGIMTIASPQDYNMPIELISPLSTVGKKPRASTTDSFNQRSRLPLPDVTSPSPTLDFGMSPMTAMRHQTFDNVDDNFNPYCRAINRSNQIKSLM